MANVAVWIVMVDVLQAASVMSVGVLGTYRMK